MAKRLLGIFILALLMMNMAAFAEKPLPESIHAKSCVLMDAWTGEVLYEKNANDRRYPASTTKIMTLLISISKCDPEQMVTIPQSAGNVPLDSSRVPVYPGEVMPLQDLWYGLMFKSGNDAANAIAEATSGSISAFVDEMNAWADKFGMTHTHFENAHGYHNANHYTTAMDMAKLTWYALQNDQFREISFGTEYTMQPTSKREALPILHNYAILDCTSPYYYRYARGIKTGYTQSAGQCLVTAAIKDGRELLCVLLCSDWVKEPKWKDAALLFDYGFEVLESRQ